MKKICSIMVAFCLAVVGQVAASLVPIPLVNPGFEEVPQGDITIYGFDDLFGDIPGWSDVGLNDISGVQLDPSNAHSGENYALFYGGEPGAYQMTDHTIAAGEIYRVGFYANNIWDAPELTVTLLGDTVGNEWASYTVIDNTAWSGEYDYYEIDFEASAESVGQALGIQFSAPIPDGWIFVDDVSLSVVPEPATFTLLGLGVLFLLHKRKLTD